MSKSETLDNIEDRILDIIDLFRMIYPRFNNNMTTDRFMFHITEANAYLASLQDGESE